LRTTCKYIGGMSNWYEHVVSWLLEGKRQRRLVFIDSELNYFHNMADVESLRLGGPANGWESAEGITLAAYFFVGVCMSQFHSIPWRDILINEISHDSRQAELITWVLHNSLWEQGFLTYISDSASENTIAEKMISADSKSISMFVKFEKKSSTPDESSDLNFKQVSKKELFFMVERYLPRLVPLVEGGSFHLTLGMLKPYLSVSTWDRIIKKVIQTGENWQLLGKSMLVFQVRENELTFAKYSDEMLYDNLKLIAENRKINLFLEQIKHIDISQLIIEPHYSGYFRDERLRSEPIRVSDVGLAEDIDSLMQQMSKVCLSEEHDVSKYVTDYKSPQNTATESDVADPLLRIHDISQGDHRPASYDSKVCDSINLNSKSDCGESLARVKTTEISSSSTQTASCDVIQSTIDRGVQTPLEINLQSIVEEIRPIRGSVQVQFRTQDLQRHMKNLQLLYKTSSS